MIMCFVSQHFSHLTKRLHSAAFFPAINIRHTKPCSAMNKFTKMNSKIRNFVALITAISLLLLQNYCVICVSNSTKNNNSRFIGKSGEWKVVRRNVGVVALHMALTHKNTVLIFDQTGSGPSGYRVQHRSNGSDCHGNSPSDLQDSECYAHSVEFRLGTRKVRPLRIQSDPFGSSGSFLSNGTLLQTGGYEDESKRIRVFRPCDDGSCDWRLYKDKLAVNRLYATSTVLPDADKVVVVGGDGMFSYEFVPRKHETGESVFRLPFLKRTYNESEGGSNLYPFVHLTPLGHLFIFASRDSILLNYRIGRVVKIFPRIPTLGSRTYPSSASSILFPLDHRDNFLKAEVMVCGGSAQGAYSAANNQNHNRRRRRFLPAIKTCGRMVISGRKHEWKMEDMPRARVMSDMLILPTGDVLLVNGAQRGAGGWGNADGPVTSPYLYQPENTAGKRFSVMKPSGVARMYHSSAVLLPDGRVLVGGGNQNERYIYRGVKYPTELRLQVFAPQYTDRRFNPTRPSNITVLHQNTSNSIRNSNSNSIYSDSNYGWLKKGVRRENVITVGYREEFLVRFWLGSKSKLGEVEFNAYRPPFTTHSNAMNQRMLKLKSRDVAGEDMWVTATVEAPPSPNVAPPGYYMLFVLNDAIPGIAQWIRFSSSDS